MCVAEEIVIGTFTMPWMESQCGTANENKGIGYFAQTRPNGELGGRKHREM